MNTAENGRLPNTLNSLAVSSRVDWGLDIKMASFIILLGMEMIIRGSAKKKPFNAFARRTLTDWNEILELLRLHCHDDNK